MNLVVYLKGICFTLAGAITPWVTYLGSSMPLSDRSTYLTAFISAGGAISALLGYLSTEFANSKPDEKPTPLLSPIVPSK